MLIGAPVHELGGRCGDAAGDPGAVEAAISIWHLVQVLLVVVLGEVEGAGGLDLGGDWLITVCPERLVVGRAAPFPQSLSGRRR